GRAGRVAGAARLGTRATSAAGAGARRRARLPPLVRCGSARPRLPRAAAVPSPVGVRPGAAARAAAGLGGGGVGGRQALLRSGALPAPRSRPVHPSSSLPGPYLPGDPVAQSVEQLTFNQ